MKILALIPARGGSKRLPGKNIRILDGKPLIVWSIDVAKEIPAISDVLVSTDDITIAEVSKNAGASVPWLRSAELATDTASTVDVAIHALDWYETEHGTVDGLLLLQPTSPFRTKENICKGIELFKNNSKQTVLGVSPSHSNPMWSLKLDKDSLIPYFENHGFGKRSQDLPDAYVANGCFYLISPKLLRLNKSFFTTAVQPLIIDSFKEGLDIDTEKDWELAQILLNSSCNNKPLLKTNKKINESKYLSSATASYLSENEAVFSLNRQNLVNVGKARKVEIVTIGGISKNIAKDSIIGTAKYIRELIFGWKEINKLSSLKGSKKGKKAIVIGNGPSQGLINADLLKSFSKAGNDIYAVNFWNQNIELSKTPPNYLVISDPATLSNPNESSSLPGRILKANESLRQYLIDNKNITVVAPVMRLRPLYETFGEHRILGFIDTEMRWLTSNIDPRFPRGFLSMTLYKTLALSVHMGYKQIYLLGMDNTYPRDIFCDKENRIFNRERHAGGTDFLDDQTLLTPTMDIWAQDIFKLFYDLRKCFSGSQVLNLDCYSLTDVFKKISDLNEIETLLT
jgi:CMP-N,N'-diacetyllegionaminic acid synthase